MLGVEAVLMHSCWCCISSVARLNRGLRAAADASPGWLTPAGVACLPDHCQGLDISQAMLDVAAEREVEGDLCLHDLVRGCCLAGCCLRGGVPAAVAGCCCMMNMQSQRSASRV